MSFSTIHLFLQETEHCNSDLLLLDKSKGKKSDYRWYFAAQVPGLVIKILIRTKDLKLVDLIWPCGTIGWVNDVIGVLTPCTWLRGGVSLAADDWLVGLKSPSRVSHVLASN